MQQQIWLDEMQLASVPEPLTFNANMVGPVIAEFGSQEHEGTVPAADRVAGHLVVPGVLRARGRLRPGLAADHARSATATLRGQRAEDLDHPGPARRLDLLPGPHRPASPQAAGRYLVPAHRHEHPGHHAAADQAGRRQLRGQRGVLRGRPGARRPSSSARRTRAGATPSSCSATSAPASPRSAAPSCALARSRSARQSATGLLEDPLFAARLAEAENDAAGAGTDPDAGGVRLGRRQAQPGVVGAQAARQPAAADRHRTAGGGRGPDALPFDAGDDIASPDWAQHAAPDAT